MRSMAHDWRAAADGRPYGLLPFHTAPIAGPGICGELHRASGARNGTDESLNRVTAPAPRSRSAVASRDGQGCGEYGGVGGGGDKVLRRIHESC
jgi:hypothetical protein